MANGLIRVEEIGNVLTELEDAAFDIPFENSDFQNRAFVMAAQQTPARAYRAILLRMFAKIRAIKGHKLQQERNKIDIEEKLAKIADESTSSFDRRRLELDILEIRESEAWTNKLENDALRELSCLYSEFKNFPRYTRDQFEIEEAKHFHAKLNRALSTTGNGSSESLLNMIDDLPNWPERLAASLPEIAEVQKLLGQ